MSGLERPKPRNLAITQPFFRDRTARMKGTTARRVKGTRHVALQEQAPFSGGRVRLGRGAQKRLRIGMTGPAVHLTRGRELHHPAQVHDRDTLAYMFHDVKVVGDEQIAQPELFLKVAQEVDDLRLDGNVEGANRLIGHDEARGDGKSARDADTLTLAAGELVGIAPHVLGSQANPLEQRGDPLVLLRAARTVMRGLSEL